jgi:hypothetical protein
MGGDLTTTPRYLVGAVRPVTSGAQLTLKPLELSNQSLKRRTARGGIPRQAEERASHIIDVMCAALSLRIPVCNQQTDGGFL